MDPENTLSPVNVTLQAAQDYMRRGWMPLPIPHMSKNPGFEKWQMFRTTPDELVRHFDHEKNIGILLGKTSNWLVDIDLDHPRAIELADAMLPPTPTVFGRPSKPRSHRLYYITTPAATKTWHSKSEGMIIEFRSTGVQTVFPPSIHEEGEPITWETPGAEPAVVDTDVLFESVRQIGEQVKIELGEKQPTKPRTKTKKTLPAPAEIQAEDEMPAGNPEKRYNTCLRALNRLDIVDQRDGSFRLYVCACRCVGFDLDDDQAIRCIRDYAGQKPFPKDYSDEQILKRIRDAEKNATRGQALAVDSEGLIKLGSHDPDSGRIILSPKRTLPTAKAYIQQFHTHPDGRTLASYAGLMMSWSNNRYSEIEDEAIKNRLQPWLHDALRYIYNKTRRQNELVDFESNPGTVNSALETLRTYVHLSASLTPPLWIVENEALPDAKELLPCQTMNLHIPTGLTYPATPKLFTTNALEFDYDAEAQEPQHWLSFLNELWDGDKECIALLQQWFGYCLTTDTSQQKMLLLIGPRRCGKGTIGRILTKLIGVSNVCGPTTGSLSGTFGLQPLIGKSLAIVSDARFAGTDVATVVERLLCISGEDALTIDRKHKESVTMKLATRFMFLTNELPRLTDASNALAGRFMLLNINKSWFGKEDLGLQPRLEKELPGILLWALQGWLSLRKHGRFIQPTSSQEAVEELEDLCSPVRAFVKERCLIGSSYRVYLDELYTAWQSWCQSEGRSIVSTKQTFGRDLSTAFPWIGKHRDHRPNGGRFYDGIGLAY